MSILNSFLGAQPQKTRINKGFLNGGGGGLRCNLKATKKPHNERLNECYGIHKHNKFLVQNTQSLRQNNTVLSSKVLNVFAFRYKENRRIGKNAYFNTC